MTKETRGFIKSELDWIDLFPEMSGIDFMLFGLIRGYEASGLDCYQSYASIAGLINVAEKTVRARIARLGEIGAIQIHADGRHANGGIKRLLITALSDKFDKTLRSNLPEGYGKNYRKGTVESTASLRSNLPEGYGKNYRKGTVESTANKIIDIDPDKISESKPTPTPSDLKIEFVDEDGEVLDCLALSREQLDMSPTHERDNRFVLQSKRPLKNYPALWLSDIELAQVAQKYLEADLSVRAALEFLNARTADANAQGNGKGNGSHFVALTGWVFQEKLKEADALARLEKTRSIAGGRK